MRNLNKNKKVYKKNLLKKLKNLLNKIKKINCKFNNTKRIDIN